MGTDPGWRAVPDASLHVTLCFLGLRPAADVEVVAQACDQVGERPVRDLVWGEVLFLPHRRPRVLAVKVQDPHRQLAGLQADLSQALVAGGVLQEAEPGFLPHVTVARARRGAQLRPRQLPAPVGDRFDAGSVTLYRSHLGRGPARYERLHRAELSRR